MTDTPTTRPKSPSYTTSWDVTLGSDATPGGCWSHFSVLDVDGYRSLLPGQRVRSRAESPGQDGFSWRAVRVDVDGQTSAASPDPGAGSAYRCDLSLTWDDDA